MNNIESRFSKANKLLDESRFEEAIHIFREIAFIKPSLNVLTNLQIAWNLSHLQFLRQLVDKFPYSPTSNIELVTWYISIDAHHDAYRLCNDLMQKYKNDENVVLRLKSLRLTAAGKTGHTDYIMDDFISVWKSLSSKKGKIRLLQDTLATSKYELIPVFLQLSKQTIFPTHVQILFLKKSESLEILKSMRE